MAIPESNPPNLSALDGARCLTCIAIIMLHVHYALGALFFPSNAQCMKAIQSLPIISTIFLNVTFQMTLFWTMSGFLCEYQLSKLREQKIGKVGWDKYGKFLLNRLLRLYPLYFLTVTLLFLSQGQTLQDSQTIVQCTRSQYLSSLFFVTGDTKQLLACVGQAWTVIMDIHGYLTILVLSLLFSESVRRCCLVALYSFSLAYMRYIDAQGPLQIGRKELDKLFSFGFFSLEYAYPEELRYSLEGADIDTRALYPDIDFNSDHFVAARDARFYHYSKIYYTSIFKHASAMLLGSLLYLNLKASQRTSQNRIMVLYNLVAVFLILFATGSRFYYTGMVAYLFLDIILRLHPGNNLGRLGKVLFMCFSNRFWAFMAPYTYGIYMAHEFLIIRIIPPVFQARANQILQGDLAGPCRDYNLQFILRITTQVWLMSWIAAFVLHHTFEMPFNYFRKRAFTTEDAVRTKTHHS